MVLNNTKFTNIMLTGAIVVFVIMGMLSLQLNFVSIENQNKIILEQKNDTNESKTIISLINDRFGDDYRTSGTKAFSQVNETNSNVYLIIELLHDIRNQTQ